MKLLIDIGNSRLKWALADEGKLCPGEAADYRLPQFAERLQQVWCEIEPPQQLAIASVAETTVLNTIRQLSSQLWPDAPLFIARSTAFALGVSNAYQQPEKLGVDRWLALLAAHRHYPGKVCIIDCGSAMTVDLLEADGKHVGGLISPGLMMMRRSLGNDAAALTFDEQIASLKLGSQTNTAIANGCLMAATGLVLAVKQQLAQEFQLLLTGGDGRLLVQHLAIDATFDADLVLKGLLALADEEDRE